MFDGISRSPSMLGGTAAALNLFVRAEEGQWRLVAHHASPVSDSET